MIGQQLKEALGALMPNLKDQQAGAPSIDQYEEIILTEQEIAEALRIAREQKYFLMKREEYRNKLNAQSIYPAYSAQQLKDFFEDHLDIDDDNVSVVKQLCLYFSKDPRFKGDLDKGILLMGHVGVGKSILMEFFKQNQVFSYKMQDCREVEMDVSSIGEDGIRNRSYNITVAENASMFGHKEFGFCFDDLGTEKDSKHYGATRNVMAEILLNRYSNRLPFNSTHVTTNLTFDQLKENYGQRVMDRFKEMFNVIQFDPIAKSRRK